MLTSRMGPSRNRALFELREFASLPCGCVAGGYVASALGLDVAALEVKGPHCLAGNHKAGSLLAPDDVAGRFAGVRP
ncbi:MAG: hypothetical protein O3A25_10225 [Acidobacteria bacterium]|nr:hypothetical protein [Acidobacteriota bacterium]